VRARPAARNDKTEVRSNAMYGAVSILVPAVVLLNPIGRVNVCPMPDRFTELLRTAVG
jgi:hypothetical protein